MNSYEFHSENDTTKLLSPMASSQLCGQGANVLRVGLNDVQVEEARDREMASSAKSLSGKHEDLSLSRSAEDVIPRTGHGGACL